MWAGEDWTSAKAGYDRLLTLPLSAWGWEYARRNPDLIAAANSARRYAPVTTIKREDGTVIRLKRRCPEAERFGLHYFPDPDQSAFDAVPFWLPEACSGSLDAAAEFEKSVRNRTPLRLDQLSGERHYLIAPGRRPKLVIAAKGYAAQLAIEEGALPVPQAVFVSLKLGAGQLVGKNFGPVEEFASFCAGQAVQCRALRGLSPEKLREAIIALDGELAGVPRRRIAAALYGEKRAAADWDNGDESMKKRVKRRVEKGFDLMNEGYRNLL